MADLKQALLWLAEGKKIRCNSWPKEDYLVISGGEIADREDKRAAICLWASAKWELYEEPKPIPPCGTDVLVEDDEYIVWDKNHNRHLAYWDNVDKAFYSITNSNTFALDVKEWKKLPERDE